jgi:hypothetical protein
MIYGDGAPRIDASQNLRTLGSARVYSVAYDQCTTMASFRIVYEVPEVFVSISCAFSRLCQTWDGSQVSVYILLIISSLLFVATVLYDNCTSLNLAKSSPRIRLVSSHLGPLISVGASVPRLSVWLRMKSLEMLWRRLRPVGFLVSESAMATRSCCML